MLTASQLQAGRLHPLPIITIADRAAASRMLTLCLALLAPCNAARNRAFLYAVTAWCMHVFRAVTPLKTLLGFLL
jgi:hypothetical protein